MKLHLPKLLFTAVMAACVSAANAEFTMPAVEKPADAATLAPDDNITPGPNGFIVAGEDGIDSEGGYFELGGGGFYETKYITVKDYGCVDPSDGYLIVKEGITVGNTGFIGINEGASGGTGCIQGNVTFAKGGSLDVYTAWSWDPGDYPQSGSGTPYDMGRQPFLVKGDMTFQSGSKAIFTANDDRNWRTLPLVYVNGTLSVSGGVKFYFDNDLSEARYVLPDNGLTLFVAKAVKGDFSGISCIASCSVLDEEEDEYVDFQEKTLAMHITPRAQSNGLYAVIVTDGSNIDDPVIDEPVIDDPVIDDPSTDEPGDGPVIDDPVVIDPVPDNPVIDVPGTDDPVIVKPVNPAKPLVRVPIQTNVVMTEAQYKNTSWGANLRRYGKLDTTALPEDAVLTDRMVIGDGGKLVMGGKQTLRITQSQTVGYSITGKEAMGGHVLFTGNAQWTLAGTEYLVDDITCSQGALDIASGTRVGGATVDFALGVAGDGQTDILVKDKGTITNYGEVYAATLQSASGGVFENRAALEAGKVHIASGSAVFNTDSLTSGAITVQGALNNSGVIESGEPVVCSGTIYNSGTIQPDVNLHKGGVLDMLPGAKAGTVRVAPRASLVGSGGEVRMAFFEQYAQLGSTKDFCSLHVEDVQMQPGTIIAGRLGAATGVITVGTLTLEGDVRVVLSADAGILENPGTDAAGTDFAIPLLKVGAVMGDGVVETKPASVEDPDGVLADGVKLGWLQDTLMVYGKLNESLLAKIVEGDAALLADTMWSSAADMRNFTDAGMRQLSAGTTGAFWVSGFGTSDHMSGSGALSGYKARSSGVAVGGTLALSESDQAGLALGYAVGKHDSDNNLLSDDTKSTMLSLFYRHTTALGKQDSLSISGFAAYGIMSNEADTHVRGQMGLPGHADWDDKVLSGGVQVAWNHHVTDNVLVSPFASVSYMRVSQDDIKENSAAGNRSFDGGELQSWTASCGATLRSIHAYGNDAYVSPYLTAAYEADVSRDTPYTTGHVGGTSARGEGHNPGRHALRAAAGVDWKIDENWSAGAAYDLRMRSKEVDQSAHIYVKMEF